MKTEVGCINSCSQEILSASWNILLQTVPIKARYISGSIILIHTAHTVEPERCLVTNLPWPICKSCSLFQGLWCAGPNKFACNYYNWRSTPCTWHNCIVEISTVSVIFLFKSLETSFSVLIPENVYAKILQSVSFIRCVQTRNSCRFHQQRAGSFNNKLRVVIISFKWKS